MLRIHPQIGGAPANAKAFRIVYRSTGLKGEPIAVSATVIYPADPPPKEGRDIIAWAHYTTGVAERCAPTLLPNLSGTIAGLEQMLSRGYVVVATDYAGLGLPGVHAYLVGISEARSVLDSVRAARNLSGAHATNKFAVWGHSQGGHAALFTGELAPKYAPELKLVGIAVAAPATDLVELFKAQKGSIAGDSLTAMALLSWSRTYNLPLETVLDDEAAASFEKVARSCIQSLSQMIKLLQRAQAAEEGVSHGRPNDAAGLARFDGAELAWRGRAEVPGVYRAGDGRHDRQPGGHLGLFQAAVRRRHARRHQDVEGRLAQLRRREQLLSGHRLDQGPLQGAPAQIGLQALSGLDDLGGGAC